MKVTLFVIACFVLCTTAAFAQATAGYTPLNAQPVVTEFYSHPQRASVQSLAPQEDLLNGSTIVYAQGERPLWEVMPWVEPTPLGDAARALRKEHSDAKRAKKCWVNQ